MENLDLVDFCFEAREEYEMRVNFIQAKQKLKDKYL